MPADLALAGKAATTGEVDQAAFATAIRPLWWKRGEDAAEDLSRRCAVVVADR